MIDTTDPADLSPIRQKMLDLAASAVGLGVNRTRTMDGVTGTGYTEARIDCGGRARRRLPVAYCGRRVRVDGARDGEHERVRPGRARAVATRRV